MNCQLLLILTIALQVGSFQYHKLPHFNFNSKYHTEVQSNDNSDDLLEDGVSLITLRNVENDGNHLKQSVSQWLDNEYIPLDIHQKIGKEVERIYAEKRNSGVNDLGSMLIEIGTELEKVKMDDAFVNAWDVANKVSELLMLRLGRETCDCSGEMINPPQQDSATTNQFIPIIIHNTAYKYDIATKSLLTASRELKDEFSRYKLLKDFIDGNLGWEVLRVPLALVLGFRVFDDKVYQDSSVAPVNWENLNYFPDFEDVNDITLITKIENDLPEDEGGTDVVIESLAGIELFKQMKLFGNADTLHRIRVSKWLYVQGFFNDVFPFQEKFIPFHLTEDT